jgi:hypothetical protein
MIAEILSNREGRVLLSPPGWRFNDITFRNADAMSKYRLAIRGETNRFSNNMPLSSLRGKRMLRNCVPLPLEWQWIIATTVLAPRCINRGIGLRRFCRATPPTIPDRQAVPVRWGPF